MNEVMQIDQSSACNTSSTSSPATAEDTPSSPAGPMVFTVGQGSAPVLKLVSPVEGGAPQLIKVVPAMVSASDGGPQTEGGTVRVHKVEDEGVLNQRVYSIVQKPAPSSAALTSTTSTTVTKTAYNNGQQRVHTIGALPPTARVIPASAAAAAAQKVQILSNVVVSKQNIVLNKNALQAQRQIIATPLAQKQLNNNTQKPTIAKTHQQTAPKVQTVNNVVLTTNQQKPPITNSVQPSKTFKTVGGSLNRPQSHPPQKTIKTLSPQPPQTGYVQKTTGIKTLSPQMNHYNKQLQNPVHKILPVQNQVQPRVGIKTLAPQRPPNNNNNIRANSMAPKPNYIGKHASQAQKSQQKSNLAMKNRIPIPRSAGGLSPTKYNNQKTGVGNTQSTFNQSLTAQILQSLPSSGSRTVNEVGFPTTKNYPLQSPPDDTTLSEDIGEEVKPAFSPNLSYLYQVVMLDHNYGAPPPALSPPPVMSRSSGQHQTPGPGGSALNGAMVSRDRDLTTGAHYQSAAAKRAQHRLPPSQILPGLETRGVVSLGPQASSHDDDAASTISSEGGHPDEGDEGEETETAPEGEGDEDGITRCICDFDHDDGYMICCDVCSSWQHVDCMGLDRDHIPDKYSCVRCQPRRVDRQHARAIQQRKREEFARLGSVVVGSVASGATPGAAAGAQAGLGATTGSGSGNQSDSSSDTSTESDGQQGRHHSVSLNNNIPKKRSAPVSVTGRRKSEPVRRAPLAHKRQQRRESAAAAASAVASRRAALKKREKKQIIKRKMKSRSSVDDSSQDSWPSNYPNLGTSLLQLRQWIENYEEAVTNHYSPELRARISNMRANGQHQGDKHDKPEKDAKLAPPTAAQDVQLQKCRIGNQPLTGIKIVLAGQTLAPNTPVIELRGKYMLSTQHRSAGGGAGGLLTRQHAQRPGPFLFFYRLPRDGTEVCVDTRTYGNDARFIRRSCRPNAELRHLVEKGTLHLYIITTSPVDKNVELTLRHESHDLAAVASSTGPATALVPCACGPPSTCNLYSAPHHQQHRNNGVEPPETEEKRETQEIATTHRKRRGRRASSPRRLSLSSPSSPPVSPPLPSPSQSQPPAPPVSQSAAVVAPDVAQPPALSTRRASSHQTRAAVSGALGAQGGPPVEVKEREMREREREPREVREKEREKDEVTTKEAKDKKKKLTREERKMEAIMKAFERLEKAEQRKQEVQARQAQRRESDPPSSVPQGASVHPVPTLGPIAQKPENGDTDRENIRTRRKKRKGRARTVSTTSQSSTRRRTRLNSTDSYMTSGDDSSLLSPPLPLSTPSTVPLDLPTDLQRHTRSMTSQEDECLSPVREKILSNSGSQASDMSSPGQVNTAAGLLLALANGGASQNIPPEQSLANKSPDNDGNSSGSNSSLQSSPGTPLSSACLLVAAAVGPLEPGFKFPKTKKAIMNEWLNKSPEEETSSSSHQPFEHYSNKSLATLVQAASLCDSPPQPYGGKAPNSGNAKKRWLRQAISEECDSPNRPDSPPGNQEMVAPPKKRRLARESLSSEQSFTPPTTPTMLVPPSNSLDDETFPNNDEEFYETPSNTLSDSSPPNIDDSSKTRAVDIVYNSSELPGAPYHHELDAETVLKDQLEFVVGGTNKRDTALPTSLLDPRLGRDSRPVFRDSAQLLGTVEKTIRFYEESLTGPVTVSTPQIQSQISVSPQPSPIQPLQPLQPVQPIVPPPKPSPVLVPTISPPPVVESTSPPPVIVPTPPIVVQPVVLPVAPVVEEVPPPVTPPQVSPVATPPPASLPLVVSMAPVAPQAPQIKEKLVAPPQPKPEVITPAKRKLSISEYRQRKQLKAPDRSVSPTPDRCTSPETPPLAPSPASNNMASSAAAVIGSGVPKPRPRSRSASTSSTTSSLSSDEEMLIGGAGSGGGSTDNGGESSKGASVVEPQVAVAFNSAPTAVERQRENVERLKKAFGLSLDDETRRNNNPINRDKITPSPKTLLSSPLLPHASTELPKSLEPTTKFSLLDSKFPALDSKAPKRLALENVTKAASSPEPVPVISPTSESKQEELKEEKKAETYPKFEEVTSFIPPFNNPVYPNSTQFTSFSSVIDSSPYEGRNPSPPPTELLKPSKLSSYPSGTPLTMSPSSGYK